MQFVNFWFYQLSLFLYCRSLCLIQSHEVFLVSFEQLYIFRFHTLICNYLGLILYVVWGMDQNWCFLHVHLQLFWYHLWKRLLSLNYTAFASLLTTVDPTRAGLCLDFPFCPIDPFASPASNATLLVTAASECGG